MRLGAALEQVLKAPLHRLSAAQPQSRVSTQVAGTAMQAYSIAGPTGLRVTHISSVASQLRLGPQSVVAGSENEVVHCLATQLALA